MAEPLRPDESSPRPDYEIRPYEPDEPTPPPTGRSTPTWVVAALLVVAAAAAWFILNRSPATIDEPAREAAVPAPPTDQALPALGGPAATVTVPPLDQSDAVVRELVRQLTTHPTVAAWLTTDGLIRNFTVVTANVADGAAFQRHLRNLRPTAPFPIVRRGDLVTIDPAGYRRYDTVAAAVTSIDPDGAARLYATLKPRIEEAYRELGHPDGQVDRAIEQSIVRLLRTPVLESPPSLRPGVKGIGYVFADAELESLSPAQKQLLRMGPDNTRAIQRSLRAMALALGIPSSRLPLELPAE